MGDWIRLDSDQLRAHASRVGQNAGDVRLAENAAASLNLGGGAFGAMCAFLVAPATLVSTVAVSTITSAATLLDKTERDLRALADDVDAVEDEHLSTVAGVNAQLGGSW